jgi:serine/threonine-protein kinase RsbW
MGLIKRTRQNDRLGNWLTVSKHGLGTWVDAKLSAERKAGSQMLKQAHLVVSSHLEELSAVQQWFHAMVSHLAAEFPWIDEQFDQLNLALAEGFTNAVRHAHAHLPSSTPIEIELLVQPKQVEIRIFDQGAPFDPDSLNEPIPGSLREGGYGWFLLRRLADKVTYDCVSTDNFLGAPTDSTAPDQQGQPINSEPINSLFSGDLSGNLSGNLSGEGEARPNNRTAVKPSHNSRDQDSVVQMRYRNCLKIIKTLKAGG